MTSTTQYPTSRGLIQAKDVQDGDVLVLPQHVARARNVRLIRGGPQVMPYIHMHMYDTETGAGLYGIIRGEGEWVELSTIPDRYLPKDEE